MKSRIIIDWTSLDKEKCVGIVKLDVWNDDIYVEPQTDTFQIDVSKGSVGISGLNGKHLPVILNEDKELYEKLQIMVQSYYKGLTQSNSTFFWHGLGVQ